ncbi:GNAT family N-acetyltransferase [Leptothermofonsia sichuanensis]|uniref:GNAT family N-acetyltransferase n=1 Tax=Leptothermofonsia sichuanensis TaxID=2917832 RepID=UPI001EF1476B
MLNTQRSTSFLLYLEGKIYTPAKYICSNRFTYVADDTGTIAGFAELEPDGHIDCFYCHKNYQRCGVGRQLYQAIEARARDQGIRYLTVEASITAQPFFQRMGFSLIKEQETACRGETFTNYVMEKWLEPDELKVLNSYNL